MFWNGFYTKPTLKIPTKSLEAFKLSKKPEIKSNVQTKTQMFKSSADALDRLYRADQVGLRGTGLNNSF